MTALGFDFRSNKHILKRFTTLPLVKPFLTRGGWHELKCVLGFSRFVVSFDVQNGFVSESFSFEHHCVEESIFIDKY